MIVGLGIDVVEIARMRTLHARYGPRLARRILGPDEWSAYEASTDPARLLAKRFAVKEAAGKALGTGIGRAAAFRDVVTRHEPGGAPVLVLGGGARARAERLGVRGQHLSIADERGTAVAVVVLEGGSAGG